MTRFGSNVTIAACCISATPTEQTASLNRENRDLGQEPGRATRNGRRSQARRLRASKIEKLRSRPTRKASGHGSAFAVAFGIACAGTRKVRRLGQYTIFRRRKFAGSAYRTTRLRADPSRISSRDQCLPPGVLRSACFSQGKSECGRSSGSADGNGAKF